MADHVPEITTLPPTSDAPAMFRPSCWCGWADPWVESIAQAAQNAHAHVLASQPGPTDDGPGR